MPFGIDEVSRRAAAGALPAPVGAGGPGGIDGEVGPEEVESLAGLVVSGDIQLPDVEGLALVGLELLIFLGGVLFLQDVAGGGVLGDDAGRSLQLHPFPVVEDLGRNGRGQQGQEAAKGECQDGAGFHGGILLAAACHSRASRQDG